MNTFYEAAMSFGPEFFLPMNEASGPFVDVTGHGYDATVFGTFTRNSMYSNLNGAGGCEVNAKGDGYAIIQKPTPWLGRSPSYTVVGWAAMTNAMNPGTRGYLDRHEVYVAQPAGERLKGTVSSSMIWMMGARQDDFYAGSINTTRPNIFTPDAGSANRRDDENFQRGNTYVGDCVSNDLYWSQSSFQFGRFMFVYRSYPAAYNQGSYSSALYGISSWFHGTKDNAAPPFTDDCYTFGLGLFGLPISASTIIPETACQKHWLSNIVAFNYALTETELGILWNAGQGVLTGNRVAGSTLLDGVALGGFPVTIHRRDTGARIGRGVSDVNGAFSINVGNYSGHVYAVCFDTVSGQNFPAQVFDLITPST